MNHSLSEWFYATKIRTVLDRTVLALFQSFAFLRRRNSLSGRAAIHDPEGQLRGERLEDQVELADPGDVLRAEALLIAVQAVERVVLVRQTLDAAEIKARAAAADRLALHMPLQQLGRVQVLLGRLGAAVEEGGLRVRSYFNLRETDSEMRRKTRRSARKALFKPKRSPLISSKNAA